MNERVKRRERRIDIAIIVMAVIITVLFHSGLLFLFSPPAVADVKVKPVTNRIVMLSGNGRNSKVGKSILNWMKYRNPTLISKPNEKFGFGRLQAKDNFRKRLNDLSLAEEMDKDVIKVLSFEKLSGNSDEDGAHPHKLWNIRAFSPLPEIAGIPPAKVNSDFPAWKNSRGEILTQLFSSEDKKNLAEEVGKLKPSGETVISIHFNGRNILPRFRIIKSCGFLVLDRKALKSLILNYRELFDSGFESGNVIIEWGPFRAE